MSQQESGEAFGPAKRIDIVGDVVVEPYSLKLEPDTLKPENCQRLQTPKAEEAEARLLQTAATQPRVLAADGASETGDSRFGALDGH